MPLPYTDSSMEAFKTVLLSEMTALTGLLEEFSFDAFHINEGHLDTIKIDAMASTMKLKAPSSITWPFAKFFLD